MRNYKVKHDNQTRMIRPAFMRYYPGTVNQKKKLRYRKHWAHWANAMVYQIQLRKRDEARNERLIREALIEKPTDLVMSAGGAL